MVNDGDEELVRRCLQGDREAFEPLVARYQHVLFNVALRMVGDYEDARDVAQTAFVKAYAKLGSFDPRHRFFSWLYRIMVNEALNLIDRRKPGAPLPPGLAVDVDPGAVLEATECAELVETALGELPPESREVLVLRHFGELSYQEMAETLAIPEKTVKSRLFTARQRLGEILLAKGVR